MSGCAVMVMPRGTGAWPTAEALWITAEGWARAAERRFGAAWIATPDGAWPPGELPRRVAPTTTAGRRRPLPVPALARTLLKDLRLGWRQSRFALATDDPWSATQVRLVWEHHDLFNQAGRSLADAVGAPLVRYVHAPQVWEAAKWGVRRPVWGRWLEAGESRALRGADLVACVSTAVRERLLAMGLDRERIVVAPMAVDVERFHPDGVEARQELGIDAAAVVVGWCGSFRAFHGLDGLLSAFTEAAGRHPELHLLLVGDGAARPALEAQADELGLTGRVTFAGRVAHADMPSYLRSCDLAVVSSDGRGGFHYSPLKLREYAACALPVVAPAEGELVEIATATGGDEGFLQLHPPGDLPALAAALSRLAADRETRNEQGRQARRLAVNRWSWRRQLEQVMERLDSP